jgi:hypothetical protein
MVLSFEFYAAVGQERVKGFRKLGNEFFFLLTEQELERDTPFLHNNHIAIY